MSSSDTHALFTWHGTHYLLHFLMPTEFTNQSEFLEHQNGTENFPLKPTFSITKESMICLNKWQKLITMVITVDNFFFTYFFRNNFLSVPNIQKISYQANKFYSERIIQYLGELLWHPCILQYTNILSSGI